MPGVPFIAVPSPKRVSPNESALEKFIPFDTGPDRNKAFPPLTVMPGGRAPVFIAIVMSLIRPPQPVAPPLGSELCHCWVWSECE